MSWSNSISLNINASPEKLFAYLADFTRHAEWSSNVRTIDLIAGEAGKVGAEYRAGEDVPRNLTSFARVTELRAPNLIAWESTDNRVFKTNWTFEIAREGNGSRLTQTVTFHPLNFLANIILYLFRVPRVEQENRASLERIRQRMENG